MSTEQALPHDLGYIYVGFILLGLVLIYWLGSKEEEKWLHNNGSDPNWLFVGITAIFACVMLGIIPLILNGFGLWFSNE